MRRTLPIALLLLLLPALARGGDPAATIREVEKRIRHAERLLADWQYDEGIAAAERLYAEHPGLPAVQYLAGKAKFYRQDYRGAVQLLGRATAGREDRGETDSMLAQARATAEITEDYVSKRSEHFELRVPAGVDEILFPYALEALERAWKNIGDDFGFHPEHPIVVEAFSTADELSAASGLSVKAIKTSGTIAICKHNKLMFTSPKALLRGYEWLDTLSHEYVHYVVSRVSNNTVPIWLHEGIAKYEETRWSGEAGGALSPFAERLLAEAVQGKRDLITFEEMHPSMALLPSQEATALAFAEVFTVIEYIVAERGGYPTMRKLVAELRDGKDDAGAVQSALGVDFATFQKQWKAWLRKRPMQANPGASLATLTFKEDAKGKQVESAEDEADASSDMKHPEAKRYAHLGELLRARHRPAAAVKEYEKAYTAAGPEATLLSNKLALTHMQLESWERAEEVLKAALEPNPAFVTTHVHLGRLYLKTERPELAEASFTRANEINPFDPEIHASLSAIYLGRKEEDLARREAYAAQLINAARQHPRPRGGKAEPAVENAGWLSVHSTPWARLSIGGEDTGMTTPVFRHPLPAGKHQVVLKFGGDVEKAAEVTIEAGEDELLEVQLEPQLPSPSR